jgi:ATP-dependent Lon protease
MLEGWFMPRISKNTPSKMLGFKGDFFGEVLHELRPRLEFADYVSHSLRLPSCEDMRDNKAISRIAEGYLKLLFPDLNVTEEEFIEFCVNPALRMRQQIRDELTKIDSEYAWVSIKSTQPDEFQLLHPDEKPEVAPNAPKSDPLPPSRPPEATTIDIKEGETGISYRKLFEPYLRGAKEITLIDPYIRLDYQIFNLMSFIEMLAGDDNPLALKLITAAGSHEEEVELSEKLDQVQAGATAKKIEFSYVLDSSKHDRTILTDTGWRIILGRGLDFFHRAEGRYSLGFIEQSQRKCKETAIVFTRV